MEPVTEFASALQVAVKALQLYAPVHPRSVEALASLGRSIETLFGSRNRLQVVSSNGELFIDRRPVDKVSPHISALARQMQERKIGGFVFSKGVSAEDLQVLLGILNTKPQRLDELGGPAEILRKAEVSTIRISNVRYEELREGEEVVDSALLLTVEAGGAGPDDPITDVFRRLSKQMKAAGDDQKVGDPRALPRVDLRQLAERFNRSDDLSDPVGRAAATEAIRALDPDTQAQLIASRESVEAGPFRTLLDEMAPELAMNVVSALAANNISAAELPEMMTYLMTQLSHTDRSMERLKARLESLNIDQDQLDDLLLIMSWEVLADKEKVRWLSEGPRIFELPGERLLTFLRELLSQKRHDELVTLLERYSTALSAESIDMRGAVLENFIRIASWGDDPGFDAAEEALLQRVLFTHFLREPDARMQHRGVAALSAFIGTWMRRGRGEKATRALTMLQNGTAAAAAALPWKKGAFDALVAQVSKDHVRAMLPLLYTREHDAVAAELHPLLALLGAPAAAELIDELGVEDDRSNRGRIIRAIKAIGRPALIPLRHSLTSPTWYLVRNTLNLLGDLNAVELIEEIGLTLKHEDARVRRAAARALGRLGGARAEELLLAELRTNDAELQGEILFSLAGMKSEAAVIPLSELVRAKRIGGADDATRERAIETLGAIGSVRAVPALEELLRRRSLLAAAESPAIKVAAVKALAQINTPEARIAIQKAVESEASAPLREQLERFVTSA